MVEGTSSSRAEMANAKGAPIRPVAEPASTFRQRAHSAFWPGAGCGKSCISPQSGQAIRSATEGEVENIIGDYKRLYTELYP